MIPPLAHFSFIQPGEWGQYTDDIRQLFVELAEQRPGHLPAPAGTCRPSVDVFETDEAIELIVDASGMSSSSLRVLFPVDLAEQRAKLAATVRIAIESLRTPERLVPILEDLGRRHVNYGVLPRHLRVFGETLLEALAAFDGEHWDSRTAGAWERAYQAISLAMEQGMRLPG